MKDYDSRGQEGGPEDTQEYREFVQAELVDEAARVAAQGPSCPSDVGMARDEDLDKDDVVEMLTRLGLFGF